MKCMGLMKDIEQNQLAGLFYLVQNSSTTVVGYIYIGGNCIDQDTTN